MARIQLERLGGYVDVLRKYKVVIDGEQRGTIAHDETMTLDVESGRREVMLKIDWARSRKLLVDIADDATVRLRCKPNATPMTGIWYSTFGRSRYIDLAQV